MYEINGDTILRAEDSMKILIDPQHLSQLMDKGGYTLIGDKTNLLESENKKDNKIATGSSSFRYLLVTMAPIP